MAAETPMIDPSASPRVIAALRELVEKWRREGHSKQSTSGHYASGYEDAKVEDANELDALLRTLGETGGWQPIETAPKGTWFDGPNDTRDPAYVEPPRLWLLLDDGEACVGYADAYYAEGGNGYDGGSYWVEKFSGERVNPTHWMPLPAPPPEVTP